MDITDILSAFTDGTLSDLTPDKLADARARILEFGRGLKDRAGGLDGADLNTLVGEAKQAKQVLAAVDAELAKHTPPDPAVLAEALSVFDEPVAASRRIRRPPAAEPVDGGPRVVVASAGGARFRDAMEVASELAQAARRGGKGEHVIATIPISGLPELGGDRWENYQILSDVAEGVAEARAENQALVAAGFCAPSQPLYDFFQVGGRGGIIELPEVSAPRGRVSRSDPITPSTLAGTAGIGSAFTAADDEAATEKSCYAVDCGADHTFEVEATYTCVQTSNFDELFYPERVAQVVSTGLTVAAHNSNGRLIDDIVTSPDTTFINDLEDQGGSWTAFARSVERVAAWYREREKMEVDALLELVVPSWLAASLAADTTARDSSTLPNLIPSLAEITDQLRNAGVRPQWVHDWQAPDQASAFDGFVSYLLFAPGAVIRLRGASLDIGVVRDSTLNIQNRAQHFFETFDAIATMGPVAYVSGVPACSTGGTGARVTISCAGS